MCTQVHPGAIKNGLNSRLAGRIKYSHSLHGQQRNA